MLFRELSLLLGTSPLIDLTMVGPDIASEKHASVKELGKRLNCSFFRMKYHEYVKFAGSELVKPTICIAFNSGCHDEKVIQLLDSINL